MAIANCNVMHGQDCMQKEQNFWRTSPEFALCSVLLDVLTHGCAADEGQRCCFGFFYQSMLWFFAFDMTH